MDSYVDLIGFVAAFCTTVSFIPQVLKTWRTRDLAGISLGMYSVFTVGIAFWLVYGLLQSDWPLVIANSITGSLSLTILIMKIRYGRR